MIIDWIFFFLFAEASAYILFFAVCSKFAIKKKSKDCLRISKIAVLIPAYKEDIVIENSLNAILKQDYPVEAYKVIVVADKFEKDTIDRLSNLPVLLHDVNFDESSKANALKFAVSEFKEEEYDIVVILDADNIVFPTFLSDINKAYCGGSMAIQAHRRAKNTDTSVAILDAASEEINNSVFRKGHIAAGFSSALIGSGMAFDYNWFKNNVFSLFTAGEDKELERILLKQKIFIDYLPDTDVLDEKIRKSGKFYNQRRRWVAAQFYSFSEAFRDIPSAVRSKNIDYLDKILQWMLPPRIILLGGAVIAFLTLIFINPAASIKWFIIIAGIITAFSLSLPPYLANKKLLRALIKLPWLFVLMFLQFFRIRGGKTTFIHTEHNS